MISEKFKVFGWDIHHCKLDVNEQIRLTCKRETTLSQLAQKTIYTKGLITTKHVNDPSKQGLTRVPGFCTDNLPDPLPIIDLIATAQTNSEWWCINILLNKGPSSVKFINIPRGESRVFSQNDLIFICEGSISVDNGLFQGPISLTLDSEKNITTQEDTYGFIFDKRNENI